MRHGNPPSARAGGGLHAAGRIWSYAFRRLLVGVIGAFILVTILGLIFFSLGP
ncbi:MAG: hypothetical protein Q7T33_10015 [Dehalococcoidia bacterium]|nr:hypothetical protein [Dehalococcoidia bacterium]